MNKQELLKMIEELPDNVECQPIEFTQQSQIESEWYSEPKTDLGVYQKDIRYELNLKLNFKECLEGNFKRTYENIEGSFRDIRRVR